MFFFSSRRRHTRLQGDWSSDVCSSDLFQEFGPAGFHVSIGFANPAIINARKAGVCGGTDPTITGTNCSNTVTGKVTTERMSRTPDQRLYSSGSNESLAFTPCYVNFGDPGRQGFCIFQGAA